MIARALACAAWAISCGEPSVDGMDGGNLLSDRGVSEPPPAPTLDPIPAQWPYSILTLRGQSAARRVIVEGADNPTATSVLPDHTFCTDVPLRTPRTYDFKVFAQSQDGQLSDEAAMLQVAFTPGAPAIPGASTCSGADPAGCPSPDEICGNGRDDNCNGLTDAQDPACATCTDDLLEPNNDVFAPRIDPGRYDDLKICPDNVDYYGIFLRRDEKLDVRIFFVHALGNLDAELRGLNRSTVLVRSVGLSDDEVFSHTATTTGEYKLVVFGDSGVSNTYTLDLRITAAP